MFDLDIGALPNLNNKEKPKSNKTYKVPPAGLALCRMVGYVELGQHKETYMGEEKTVSKVEMIFELHGRNYPVEGGNPMRLTVKENLSYHEKSNFFKLFMMLKGNDQDVKHPVQLVGKAFKVRVHNVTSGDKIYAVLKTKEKFYEFSAPVTEDVDTGEIKTLNVPAMLSKPKAFVWAQPTKETWDSLFIDGSYQDGNSKNVLQNKILSAVNYPNSLVKATVEGGEIKLALTKEEPKKTTHFEPRSRYDRKPQVELKPLPDDLFGDD